METLGSILKRSPDGLEEGWLYLSEIKPWNLDTSAVIIDLDQLNESELDEEDEPKIAGEKGLICTIDSATIESVVSYLAHTEPDYDDSFLLESFLYYYEYDAFLPEPGFKPLSTEESVAMYDREFYDLLGEENKGVQCKTPNCNRGKINSSSYCKIHHFEMIQKKPCPFSD